MVQEAIIIKHSFIKELATFKMSADTFDQKECKFLAQTCTECLTNRARVSLHALNAKIVC